MLLIKQKRNSQINFSRTYNTPGTRIWWHGRSAVANKTNEMVACVGRIELSCFLFPSSDSPRTTEEEVCPDAVVPPSRWSNPQNIAVATWSVFKYLLQTSCSSDRELLPLEKSAVAKVLQQTLAWPTEYTSTNQPTNHTASPNRYRLSSCCHVRSRLAQTKPRHI